MPTVVDDLDYALQTLDDLDKEVAAIVDAPDAKVKGVDLFNALQYWFPTNPLLWNAGKHLVASVRGGQEELEKALWYIEQELKRCKQSSSS
jgi:hypothetical protein